MIKYYIFCINCVPEMMYSQYNSNPYQPLRADTEGSAVNHERVETFARKTIRRMINFN